MTVVFRVGLPILLFLAWPCRLTQRWACEPLMGDWQVLPKQVGARRVPPRAWRPCLPASCLLAAVHPHGAPLRSAGAHAKAFLRRPAPFCNRPLLTWNHLHPPATATVGTSPLRDCSCC
jgi:hypothetical protein